MKSRRPVKHVHCPRPYRLGQRQTAAEETHARILGAARDLLIAEGGYANFTIDAVAQQAAVARMTIYHQFGSKAGLLEALCDDLAIRGRIEQLAGAFVLTDPGEALAEFIAVLCRFYDADRLLTRRLVGLAALDPDFEQVLRGRYARRREGLRVLVDRLATRYGCSEVEALDETVDVLDVLTSFSTFDALADTNRGPAEVATLMRRLVHAALELPRVPR